MFQLNLSSEYVAKALALAIEAHAGQKRWNGDEYITHPVRVAQHFDSPILQTIALLHDVVEDTNITFDELRLKFGDYVANCVGDLTKQDGEAYADFIFRLSSGDDSSIEVKLADLCDNLSDLKDGPLKDKYELAEMYLQERFHG